MQQRLDDMDAQRLLDLARAQRSITSAVDVGRNVLSSSTWNEGSNSLKLYEEFDAPEDLVQDLIGKLVDSLPTSWLECKQLEIEARAKSNPGTVKRRKADLSSQPANSAALQQSHVQLCWGYLLRQLEQVAAEHAQWHLHDTSASGITGHSGKVDYCFTADKQKAWPQVVTLAELKKDLQLHSLYTECIGQLTSRSDNVFFSQPARKFLVAIAGGADQLEVLIFYRNHTILRSGPQPLSLERDSPGIRWLCKVLSSSPSAMGFVAELPPFVSSTPAGLFECKFFMVCIENVVVFKLQECMFDCRRCS